MDHSIKRYSLDDNNPVYKLSVASELSGIPATSIRYYIDHGLIFPFKKETGRHLFSKEDINRLDIIYKQLNEMGLNVAVIRTLLAIIPCWAIRSCSTEERQNCQGYHSVTEPCWEASEKGRDCRNTNCRECSVYRIYENNNDIKSLLKTLI